MDVHYSSESHDWATPQDFFDGLNAEFGFTLDAAAAGWNAKCPRFFAEADDALNRDWDGVVWLNPPYGRAIGLWVAKARAESLAGRATVVCLIPARTDTAYWHDHAMKGDEIRFIRGRLRFTRPGALSDNAPFPCALVIFRKRAGDTRPPLPTIWRRR